MILIIGTGMIAEEYIKILQYMGKKIEIVGNTTSKSKYISNKYSVICYDGGIENFKFVKNYNEVIIATPEILLFDHLKIILNNCKSIKKIFVEKPCCLYDNELKEVIDIKNKLNNNCKIFIAYNRRFYSSLEACNKIIVKDQIVNAELEIYEYNMKSHVTKFSNEILNTWFNNMTSHVVDMFFNIIGKPKELDTEHHGIGTLDWHPKCSIFSGNGTTDKNIQFKYYGDWNKNGKWKIKLFLNSGKILEFQPLEDLKIIDNTNTSIINREEIDIKYKPGFYRQTETFLSNEENLKTIEEQYYDYINVYNKISNYQQKYNVMIIGTGNIGFRYIQAMIGTKLNLNLNLVDISSDNIKRCEDYLKEINFNSFKFYNTTNEINSIEVFDLIIISTCSSIRLKLIQDLINNKNIKKINKLILEKIIFTSMEDFNSMEKLIENKIKLEDIYVPSWEYNRFNLDKYDLSNCKINLSGNGWGLACNSIHAIICFLNIYPTLNFKGENLQLISSKRNNYKEILGKFVDENVIIEDNPNLNYLYKLEIIKDDLKIIIETNFNSILTKIFQKNKLIEEYSERDVPSSEYCIRQFKNIIYGDKVLLADYKLAKKAHHILLDTIKPLFKDYDKIPIT